MKANHYFVQYLKALRTCFCFGFHKSEATSVSLDRAHRGKFLLCCLRCEIFFFGKTCGMEMSISISELSAEDGVTVVNAYELMIRDNKDHHNDSTTVVCRYLYVTTVEISSLRFGIRKVDLTCFVC